MCRFQCHSHVFSTYRPKSASSSQNKYAPMVDSSNLGGELQRLTQFYYLCFTLPWWLMASPSGKVEQFDSSLET